MTCPNPSPPRVLSRAIGHGQFGLLGTAVYDHAALGRKEPVCQESDGGGRNGVSPASFVAHRGRRAVKTQTLGIFFATNVRAAGMILMQEKCGDGIDAGFVRDTAR